MNASQKKRVEMVTNNGVKFMELTSPDLPGVVATGYINTESRGYKTNFEGKNFFYLLTKDGKGVFAVKGITKDSRRKKFEAHCREHGINCKILNQKYYDEWMK